MKKGVTSSFTPFFIIYPVMKKNILHIVLPILIIALFFFVLGCGRYGGDLEFAYEEHMKLDKDEILINPVTKDVSDQFYKYSHVKGSDIALNKTTKGKNLSFISVSLKLKLDSFKQLQNSDTSFIKIYKKNYFDEKEQRKYYSFFLKKTDMFIFRTIYMEPKYNDLIVYDILNKDSLKILKLYRSETYILKKIIN